MSVCELRDTDVKQDAAPAPVVIAGSRTAFVLPDDADGADLSSVRQAGTMAELRNLNGTDIDPDDKEKGMTLKIRFAGKTWAAFITPNNGDYNILTGYDEGKVRPMILSMYAWASLDERNAVLDEIKDMTFRPWFLHEKAGAEMGTTNAVHLSDDSDAAKAWELLHNGFDFNADMTAARSAETLLLPEDGYQMALEGGEDGFPGFILKADNSRILWLCYYYDAGILAAAAE